MLVFVMPAIFPYEGNKQSGNYIYEQCEVINKHGNKMVILDSSSRNYQAWGSCKKIFKYMSGAGEVYVRWVRGIAQSRLPRTAVYSYIRAVGKSFKQALSDHGKPDIIYAHFTFPCGYAARKLSKKYNIPYAVEEHYSLFLRKDLPGYLKKITKKTIEDAKAFFCVSKPLRDNIIDFTGTKKHIDVIPNLINDRYRYYPPVNNDKFVFFSAGNLFRSKKFDLLINAFCRAFKKEDKVVLRIGGAGTEFENLKALIRENDREGQIELLGRLSPDEMLREYIACNCFALLSEYETFGIVYREAMAVGRPVIAAKNGGIEEDWEDRFGILTERNDLEQSAKAMRYMKDHASEYDNAAVSSAAVSKYSSEKIYEKIIGQLAPNIQRS